MKLEVILVEPSKKFSEEENRNSLIEYLLLLKDIRSESITKH